MKTLLLIVLAFLTSVQQGRKGWAGLGLQVKPRCASQSECALPHPLKVYQNFKILSYSGCAVVV